MRTAKAQARTRVGSKRGCNVMLGAQRDRNHLYFGKSLNPLKTSNLEGIEVLDGFRGIRTLEGLEVLRDIRQGCSTCFQSKQFKTSIVISKQRVKSELRVPWAVENNMS